MHPSPSEPAPSSEDALRWVEENFPFPGYVRREAGYLAFAATVARYAPAGSRVLDYGAGPCDRTAVLQRMGYACTAVDDLGDDWHLLEGNRERILAFAAKAGIRFVLVDGAGPPPADEPYDVAVLADVIEHLPGSPRELLLAVLEQVRDGGYLLVTVPNAGNIRKRLALLRGGTNYPAFPDFYWRPGRWRGHVREYVRGDLALLCRYLALERVELRAVDHIVFRLPPWLRPGYRLLTALFPGWKDSWQLVARKPAGWTPRRSLPPDELRAILSAHTCYPYGEMERRRGAAE